MGINFMAKEYHSFLLRLLKISSKEGITWRVLMEDPHTHTMIGFDGLDKFFGYLQNLVTDEVENQNENVKPKETQSR
jgi:hypothetical protein